MKLVINMPVKSSSKNLPKTFENHAGSSGKHTALDPQEDRSNGGKYVLTMAKKP